MAVGPGVNSQGLRPDKEGQIVAVQGFRVQRFRGFVFTANLSTKVQIELYVALDQQYITNAESDCV